MSGVGKTTLANRLPRSEWFHYSGDYRIGTKYLAEPILDNIKHQAMQVGFPRDIRQRQDRPRLSHLRSPGLVPPDVPAPRPRLLRRIRPRRHPRPPHAPPGAPHDAGPHRPRRGPLALA